jgi:hypothetical protein
MTGFRRFFTGLAALAALAVAHGARAGESESAEVLGRFLAAEQTAVMQELANWLETYALNEKQVEQLIVAAQICTSEDRRNTLWHAIRCTRSRAGREYLMRNLVDETDETTKIRFVQSLTNLAPFDVPLLAAMYQRGQAKARPPQPATSDADAARAQQPTLGEEIIKLATRDTANLAEPLPSRPEFLPKDPASSTYAFTKARQKRAQEAKAELLTWLAKNAASEKHRLAVIEPAYECLDKAHREQLAVDVLATLKDPQAKANALPHLVRLYAFDPYPLLISEEDETVRLGVIRAMHMLGSSYGYSMSSVSHGASTLRYVSQTDPSPKVRLAARQLLQRLSGGSGEAPREEPPR